MARELGKAKRSDLTGHLPGEQAEYGSALARFLEGAGQLRPLQDGTYRDSVSGNGNGHSTEISRNQTEVPTRSTDTEVATASGGNGQHNDNGSDTLFDTAFDSDEMFPEPAFDNELMQPLEPAGDLTAELEPVTFEPSADTLHPDAEPQSLDSVPDLTSPELDTPSDDADDDADEEIDTDILGRAPQLPTVRPHTDELPVRESLAPRDSGDTGILEAEEVRQLSDDERINLDDLAPSDEDETGLLNEEGESEKITSKVQPRRDVDPRATDPNAVVRDTVNFYNQTQSLHEKKKSAGFPTISPTVVNGAQPLGLQADEAGLLSPEPMGDAEPDTDTLRPVRTTLDGPMLEPALSPAGEMSLSPDFDGGFGPDEEPSLIPAGSEDETRIVMPMELQAESDIEDADKRETDKFNQDDRRPPPPPQPEGTDKLDKRQVAHEKASAVEPRGLEPLVDEKVAAGKDTQRFYVAEILPKKIAHTGDTTADLQPAEEGLPPASAADTSADYAAETSRKSQETRREPRPEPLPTPSQVHTDFRLEHELSPSARIIPEIDSEDELDEEFNAGFEPGPEYEPSLLGGEEDRTEDRKEDSEDDGDDTVDEEAGHLPQREADEEERKITEKVRRENAARRITEDDVVATHRQPARVESTRRPAVASSASSNRVKRITDSLSQRLREEHDETLRLIEHAEMVAVKLREASAQSRTDLVALSARRVEISSRVPPPVPEPAHAGTDLEELPVELPPRPVASLIEKPSPEPAKPSSRRAASRVPTSAIGEIISELELSAKNQPVSLTELLDEVSRRQQPAGGNGHEGRDDVDVLVAASARWREILAEDDPQHREADGGEASYGEEYAEEYAEAVSKRSRRHSARTAEFDEAPYEPESEPRPAAVSTLASDLDRLWEVLDSRRTSTVVLPAPERPRVSTRENELWEGWTQEMLWPTLAGIAGVTFALGALFVWVLMKWAA